MLVEVKRFHCFGSARPKSSFPPKQPCLPRVKSRGAIAWQERVKAKRQKEEPGAILLGFDTVLAAELVMSLLWVVCRCSYLGQIRGWGYNLVAKCLGAVAR